MDGIILISFAIGMLIVNVVILIVVAAVLRGIKYKNSINNITKESFNKYDDDLIFKFTCEFCNKEIDTTQKVCPHCGGHYDNNNEYKTKREQKRKEYLEFLMGQEKELEKEIENIKNNKEILKHNFIMKNRYYNMDVDEEHKVFSPSEFFEFSCEYCGTKLKGTSKDGKTCPSCGAAYNNNTELLILEKKEELERKNVEAYNLLQKDKHDRNIENQIKDDQITDKTIKTMKKTATFFKFVYAAIFIAIIVGIAMGFLAN